MRLTLTILFGLLLASCNTEENETPCTCDEIIDMRVTVQGVITPVYEISVDYCDINGSIWEQVTQQEYNAINVGDCK